MIFWVDISMIILGVEVKCGTDSKKVRRPRPFLLLQFAMAAGKLRNSPPLALLPVEIGKIDAANPVVLKSELRSLDQPDQIL
jgi:hypothetical protein